MSAAGRALSVIAKAVGALAAAVRFPAGANSVSDRNSGRGWTTIFSSGQPPGFFQNDISVGRDEVLANWSVYACISLIAADIGKLRLRLVEKVGAVWVETQSPAFSPVLRKPNRYQTRQKFMEQWIVSKLTHGNAYVLKERDDRGVVVRLYVLDPNRVTPLVATSGDVYYQLGDDDLAGVPGGSPVVPASEMIHDTMVCLFHPLVGISPIFACGLAAAQGLKIQQNSAKFFANSSQPGGILTGPNHIEDDTATRLKKHWEDNYTGNNVGKVAVLGDALKYEAMSVNPVDAELVAQLKMTAEMVCATYHVPAFKIGAGTIPAGQKVGDLNQIYYTDCLQSLLESAEALLDEGLGLTTTKADGKLMGTEFNLDDLLKMDAAGFATAIKELVGAGVMTPNEGRERFNLGPKAGGDTPYMQQQQFALSALAKRDAQDDPFATSNPAPPAPAPALPPPEDAGDGDAAAKAITDAILARFTVAARVT